MAVVSTPLRSTAPTFEELLEQDENSIVNLSMEKPILYDAENPFNLPPSIFCNIFRLNKDMVRHIVDIIRIRDKTPDQSGMPLEQQVLITLLVYANGEYQQWPGILETTDSSDSNINSIIKRVTMAVSNNMLHWIKFPVSSKDREEAKKAFTVSANPFPNAFGVMDGFHVRITPPTEEGFSFWSTCNKFYSLNVQLVCASDLRILYVNPRFPGASHDNIIWQASSAHKNLSSAYDEGERDTWLLGDGNYALQPWLMTPIPPGVTEPKSPAERYNTAHSKALGVVEDCVRALRGTWRILSVHKPIEYDPVTVANLINVCCVLHNMRCAANAPPILEAKKRKKKYTMTKRKKMQLEAMARVFNANDGSFAGAGPGGLIGGGVAPDGGAVVDPQERLKIEASRLEAQMAGDQEAPRTILGNQAAAQNIFANQTASQHILDNTFEENLSLVSDANVGGRKSELALARRIQARLIAEYFSK